MNPYPITRNDPEFFSRAVFSLVLIGTILAMLTGGICFEIGYHYGSVSAKVGTE